MPEASNNSDDVDFERTEDEVWELPPNENSENGNDLEQAAAGCSSGQKKKMAFIVRWLNKKRGKILLTPKKIQNFSWIH